MLWCDDTQNIVSQNTWFWTCAHSAVCTHSRVCAPLPYGIRGACEKSRRRPGPDMPSVKCLGSYGVPSLFLSLLLLFALTPCSAMPVHEVAHHSTPGGRGQLPQQLVPQKSKQPISFASCYIISQHPHLRVWYLTISSPLIGLKQHAAPWLELAR